MPVPNLNTGFRDNNGTDLGVKIISKDYLLSVYPGIANQLVSPELWFWGNSNVHGDNNSAVRRSTPVTTFSGGANWKQVSCHNDIAAGIKSDGTLWVWGDCATGSLGINIATSTSRRTPVTTFAGGNNWKQISVGYYYMAAIKTDGTLWTWGGNGSGRLGINEGTTANKATPVTTFIGGNDWKFITCGSLSAGAIKNDGSLWVWGNNTSAQLGINDLTNRSTPVTTFSGGNNWKQVSLCLDSGAGVKTDGSLWTWGAGTNGILGNNTLNASRTPITTFAGGNDWKQVSMGDTVCSAIKTNGSLWIWGRNTVAQLGNNSSSTSRTPITTFSGGNNWKQVCCSDEGCVSAIKTDGSLWCWGYNNVQQLGAMNTNTGVSTPITTFAGGNNWKQVDGRSFFFSAIRSTDIL